MKLIPQEGNAHWYTASGEPAYGATLREARKQNLLPSVTTKLKAWPAPALEVWKQEQVVLAALTMPEADKAKFPDVAALAHAVVESSQEEAAKAAEWGTRMHDHITAYIQKQVMPQDPVFLAHMERFAEWYLDTVDYAILTESILVNAQPGDAGGYGGKLDAVVMLKNGQKCLWDVKCRNVKKGKAPIYDTMAMQLSAYHGCLMLVPVYVNEFWSVTINRDAPELPYVYSWTPTEMEIAADNWVLCSKIWTRTLGRGYQFDPNRTVPAL